MLPQSLSRALDSSPGLQSTGRVLATRGPLIIASIPLVAKGDLCLVNLRGGRLLLAQVAAFDGEAVSLAPFDDFDGLTPGAQVKSTGSVPKIRMSNNMLGSVVDALGIPRGLESSRFQNDHLNGIQIPVVQSPPDPLERSPISTILPTGIRSIDGLCTLGYGQRIGLFAGAGVGKSTLLGMIARNAAVDVSVIALVGERGREVNDFIEESLGQEGLKKSIVVCATSDETPLRRFMAVQTATAIAEYFRARGKHVLLLVDSLTRVARAIRDVSLAAGELPVRQGYTPSVYTQLPMLLERTGTDRKGSISAIYTILINGEQELDPLGEEIKSLLDGHLVLDSRMARLGVRPAIDPLASISRLLPRLHEPDYTKAVETILCLMGRLRKDKDLLLFGGTPDAQLKIALELEPALLGLLNQSTQYCAGLKNTLQEFTDLAKEVSRRSADSSL